MTSSRFALRLVGLAAILVASTSAAHAQYAAMVFGKGAAADCYDSVKARQLTLNTLEVCTKALEDDTLSARNRSATYNNRGIVYMRRGMIDRAMRDYDDALRISPNIAETQINLGAMFYANGMYTESVRALNEGVKAQEDNSRAAAHFNRALSLEKLGEYDEAYADYKQALKFRPDFAAAIEQLSHYKVRQES
jgi:tetratricopeptide (TPR) repeat protein